MSDRAEATRADTATTPAATQGGAPETLRLGAAGLILALGPFAFGYFLSSLFRAVNAVVAPDLERDLGLDPAGLGLLTSAYLLAFALFQLPLGVLLDRFGPRKVQAALLLVAAAGSLLFSIGDDIVALTIARAMIGLGFAGGLMAGFKAVVIWVSPPRRALANAWVMCAGAVGLLVATVPTEMAVQAVGWRSVFVGLACVCALAAAIVFTIVPRRDDPAGSGETLAGSIGMIGRILSNRIFWVMAPLLATSAGSHIAIQTLWAGPWFADVASLDRDGVATHLLWMAISFFVGILLTGWLADTLGKRGIGNLTVMMGSLSVFMLSEAAILLLPPAMSLPAWIVFGMSGQVAVLAYPWLSAHFGAALSGRANTAMNLVIFLTAFALQYFIGAVIALFAPDAAGTYPVEAYTTAFGVCLIVQLVCLVWYLAGFALFYRPVR